ncbi:MAG: cyclase family protein [Kangiellaceae bacterium]|nr:cyclase family protein [Kangiellaceae bacterium]
MKINAEINGKLYHVDIDKPLSIAINVNFNGEQPNHFGASIAKRETLAGDGFVGDTQKGGSCNVDQITMVPHCNGTHTESVQHIVNQTVTIASINNNSLASCLLVSIAPIEAGKTSESYRPDLEQHDQVITLRSLQLAIDENTLKDLEALVIRTLPNSKQKKSAVYGADWQPPFFTQQAIRWLAQSNIKHLLVDFPSIDKMYDEGRLTNHHIFWNITEGSHQLLDKANTERTVTEMVFVDDDIDDGLYLLNLQFPAFELDAAPSKPLLYPLTLIADKEQL